MTGLKNTLLELGQIIVEFSKYELSFPEIVQECRKALPVSADAASDTIVGAATLWASYGFQIVEPAHKLAASLMATTLAKEYVDEFVRLPWNCFAFIVPSGLLSDTPMFAMAMKYKGVEQDRFGILAQLHINDGDTLYFSDELSIADWLNHFRAEDEHIIWDERVSNAELGKSGRQIEMIGRLFVGICVELGRHRPSDARSKIVQPSKQSAHVSPHTIKLTRPVNVDVRRGVRDYVEGIRRAGPTVQVMVRGHWKLQVHGAGRADRKLIHIEPYWRGPEDAPIAVRPHLLGEP
jgi:hypothetical protein